MWNDDRRLAEVLADILNLLTIAICFVSKLPQIRTLIKCQSSQGISLTSVSIEVLRFAVLWCYNSCFGYPVATYLEYPVLLVQQIILVYLVLKFNDQLGVVSAFAALALIISIGVFLTGTLPRGILTYLIPLCTPINAFSKLMQLAEILQTKDSTAVSLTTLFIMLFTSASRVYTVLMDSGDKLLLANALTSFSTGLSVYLAAFYYKKPQHKLKSR